MGHFYIDEKQSVKYHIKMNPFENYYSVHGH